MNRKQAKELLYQHITNENLRRHHLAAEATMRAFARHFGENEEQWGLSGLLHDLDWEKIEGDPAQHTKVTEQILRENGVTDEVLINAIKAHHPTVSGRWPETLQEKVLYSTEEITGLVTAAALVQPDKKVENVNVPSLMKKLKSKNFAAGVDRDIVAKSAEYTGMPLEGVIGIVLRAMQDIHEDLGL